MPAQGRYELVPGTNQRSGSRCSHDSQCSSRQALARSTEQSASDVLVVNWQTDCFVGHKYKTQPRGAAPSASNEPDHALQLYTA